MELRTRQLDAGSFLVMNVSLDAYFRQCLDWIQDQVALRVDRTVTVPLFNMYKFVAVSSTRTSRRIHSSFSLKS